MDKKKTNRLSVTKKAIAVAVMGTMCLSAAVSVAAMSKTVTVTDGDQVVTINTINPQTDVILEKTGISLNENDKLIRTESESSDISISILRAFNVDVVDGKTKKTLTFNDGTVADAIKAAGLTLSKNDSVSFSRETSLEPDMEIKIARFYTVNVNVKGNKITKEVPAGTVANALEYLDIKLDKNDVVSVDINKEVTENMDIVINSVTYKDVKTTESIAYSTKYQNSDDMYIGETSTIQAGVNGERTIVTREKYINGKLDSSSQVSNEITKQPVDEIIAQGTKEYVSQVYTNSGSISVNESANVLTDVNGNQVNYTRVLTGSGTAYYAPAGALTSTGRLARYGVVAVDPDIIPYGSILYIVSNDGQVVYGYAVAGDTGGALWAGTAIVDLYYNTYDECCQFGRRDVTIYVLEGVSEDITY